MLGQNAQGSCDDFGVCSIGGNERLTRPTAEPTALVVCHEVQPGSEAAYEAWLQSVRQQCRQFEGHLGAEVIRPAHGTGTYTVVVRFDSIDHLNAWLNSAERKRAIEAIKPQLAKGDALSVQPGSTFGSRPQPAL